ncbi:MAG: hypothetical protein AAFY66_06405, partial [Pseudomonadota bacterium]
HAFRNRRQSALRQAWTQAGLPGASATEIDRLLQRARLSDGRGPRPHRWHEAVASSLPDGTFVLHEGQPAMIRGDRLLPWLSSGGYGEALPRPEGRVTVLTPQPILAAIAAGYAPVMDAALP